MTSINQTISKSDTFAKYNKDFQEKLGLLILDDRPFADRMMEVLKFEFLEYKWLQVFIEKIFNYKTKYSTHPSRETMQMIVKSSLADENEATIKQVKDYFVRIMSGTYDLNDAEWIKEEALDFCRKQKLREAMIEASKKIRTSSDFDSVAKIIQDALKLGADVDFGYDYLADFEERYKESGRTAISTGFPIFDAITKGGHGRKEMGVVIAPTGTGKTFVLVHLGAAALRQGLNVVHYTLELSSHVIANRYDACLTGIPLDNLIERKEEVLQNIKDIKGTLIVKEYPTKSATTNTIRSHLTKLKQNGILPDVVIVDYADLLRASSMRKEKRDELEEIYEDLRAIFQEFDVAGWTASQTNRSGLSADIVTMESISEAFNKCFVADFIFSLSRKITDRNTNQGKMFIAKNRNGPDGLVYNIFMDTATADIKILEQYDPSQAPQVSAQEANNRLQSKYTKWLEQNGGKK